MQKTRPDHYEYYDYIYMHTKSTTVNSHVKPGSQIITHTTTSEKACDISSFVVLFFNHVKVFLSIEMSLRYLLLDQHCF